MRVTLLFFAVLREVAGSNARELELREGTRAGDVWERLRLEFPRLAGYTTPPLTAVNEEYVDANALLHDGDELAFIPPVAGG